MAQLVKGVIDTSSPVQPFQVTVPVTRPELDALENRVNDADDILEQEIEDLAASGAVGGLTAKVLQTTPSASWNLTNPLARDVDVQVYVTGEGRVYGDVTMSPTSIQIAFPSAKTGYLILT